MTAVKKYSRSELATGISTRGGTPDLQRAPPGKYTVAPQKKCAEKNDRHLFDLAPGWALGADARQWILLRARQRHAQVSWQPIAFICSTKTNLRCSMRRKGIQPTADGQAMLDALPERFLDWRALTAQKGKAK